MLGHTVSAPCWSSLQNSSVREVCSESPSSQSQLDVCFNFPFHLFSTYVRPDFQALAHKKSNKEAFEGRISFAPSRPDSSEPFRMCDIMEDTLFWSMHFLTGSFIFLWCDIEARKYLQALPSVCTTTCVRDCCRHSAQRNHPHRPTPLPTPILWAYTDPDPPTAALGVNQFWFFEWFAGHDAVGGRIRDAFPPLDPSRSSQFSLGAICANK